MINCDRNFGITAGGEQCSNSNDTTEQSRYKRLSTPINDLGKISMIHSNCQSAMNKKSEISALVDHQNPHILALSEFGAAADVSDGELGINGYSIYRGNHSSGNGGLGKGVALYVKDALNHSACPIFDEVKLDCSAWCNILLADGKRLLVGVVYRSPNSPDDNNEKMLDIMRISAAAKFDYLLVCGDFNLPRIDWIGKQCHDTEVSFSARVMEAVEGHGWFQHVKNNTRFRGTQSSCLDLIFTNEENMVDEVHELPAIGKSDHICQIWEITVKEVLFKNTTRTRLNYNRAKWEKIRDDIRGFSFESNDNVGAISDKFIAMIDATKKTNIPASKPRSTKQRLPWMRGSKIKEQRTRRWKCWTRFKSSGLPRDYDAYKVERNRLNDLIRGAKRNHERKLIADMKENPNLYYGHCRRSLKTKQGVTNVIDSGGKLTETEEETARALNLYYHSVFTRDDLQAASPPFPDQTEEQLTDVAITVEAVEEILDSLNSNKAAGPDGVENRLLKECSVEVAPVLTRLFRKSIDEGEVPQQWKEAHIVPIHKSGSKAVMSNYRPVALTSSICKILEKMVCSAIMCFLTRNNLITPQQHGFMRGRSCQTNIMLCLEKWTEILDEGMSVDVAYFDYAKAFDKVSHRLLKQKLKSYGIRGKLLEWIEAWLERRTQRVVVGDAQSPWLDVISGTTQGTVLGFLLFLIFINDLPTKCAQEDKSLIMLLADDTKTYQRIERESQQECQAELQERVDNIAQWAEEWKMEINPAKSKIMHLGKNNPGLLYYINGAEIKSVTVEKDIGFWITDDLSTKTHVNKARGKALGEISRIKRNFSYIDKRAFCVLYNQRIRPHLDYGMTACPPESAADAKLLDRVQAKATALVQGLKGLNAEERRKKLGLMTLEDRRERGDLIEVYKILKGLTRIDPAEFWEVREARNGVRLVKELAANGKKQRHGFFSYRIIQKWNLLPLEVKTAPSLESFKNRLDEKILS